MRNIIDRLRDDDRGFTLIELMVVVLIIGILIAIALPTFFGARSRAQVKQAESSLRNGLADARVCFSDEDSYTFAGDVCDATKMASLNTPLLYVDGATASDKPAVVSVNPASPNIMFLAAWSNSGTCWSIQDDAVNGTRYAQPAVAQASCAAADPGVTGATYTPTW